MLASVDAAALARCDLSGAAFLRDGSMQPPPASGVLDPSTLDPLFPAVPESSVVYRGGSTGHALLSIPFLGDEVQLRTAPHGPEGTWEAPITISTIPAPWNNASEFFCYAPKFHPGAV